MLSDLELIQYSLELDLYLSRTMMEHSMFILSGLTKREQIYTSYFKEEIKQYQEILKELISFSNGKVTKYFIDSKQLVTEYTIYLEELSIKHFDVLIDTKITEKMQQLTDGTPEVNKENLEMINHFNKKIFNQLIKTLNMLNEIDMQIRQGKIFLVIYPLTLEHIINETIKFQKDLERLLNKENLDPTYVYSGQYHYANIMAEHGLLLKSLTNPTNQKIIDKVTLFMDSYKNILESLNNDINPYNIRQTNDRLQKVTYSFLDFNELIINKIIKNEEYLIIMPLFIDHLLRESNHFLSHLNYYKNK